MDKYLERWTGYLKKKAEKTRKGYLGYFNKFIESSGLTPTSLYNMYQEAQRAEDPYEKRAVQHLVSNYMFEMVEDGYKGGTAAKVGQSVVSFFYASEIDFKIRKDEYPSKFAVGSNVIRKSEIVEYYWSFPTFQKSRNRAIMMLLKDTGLRISDIVSFDVEYYHNAAEKTNDTGERFKKFNILITEKTGAKAAPLCGPEAIQAIDEYLGSRKTGPLFLSDYGEKGTRATAAQISNLFARMKEKIDTNGRKVGAHSFRKFNQTWLEDGGVPKNWLMVIQGRQIQDSTGVYSQAEELGIHLNAYMKAYDSIRVLTEDSRKERERDKVLEELKKTVSRLESQSVWNQPKMVTGIDTEAGRILDRFFKSQGYTFLYRPQKLMDQQAAEGGIMALVTFPFLVVDADGNGISEEESDKLTKKFRKIYQVDMEDYLEKIMPVAGLFEQLLQEGEVK